MMFASKTPRDLNHDPKPWRGPGAISTRSRRATQELYLHGPGVFDPRPEFDHIQHNAPNPILVKFRQRDYPLHYWAHRLSEGDSPDGVDASTEHLDHARRVLARLVRIEGIEP